jgi:hypothetical protein
MTEWVCSIKGCGRKHHARGWCKYHYLRWRRLGDPVAPAQRPRQVCTIDGCGEWREGQGLCKLHYYRMVRYGDPLAERKQVQTKGRPTTCTVPTCDNQHAAQGFCIGHYNRWVRYGDPLVGQPPPRITCALCDEPSVADPGGSVNSAAVRIGVDRGTLKRHRSHINDPAWHIARAKWWAKELAALQAEVEQVGAIQ